MSDNSHRYLLPSAFLYKLTAPETVSAAHPRLHVALLLDCCSGHAGVTGVMGWGQSPMEFG